MGRRSSAHGIRGARGAWALWGLSMSLLAAAFFFFVSTRQVPVATDWGFRGYPIVLALPLATVGAMVASRRPENPIGWMFCFAGLLSAGQMFVEEYAVFASVTAGLDTSGRIAEWLGHWVWLPGVVLIATSMFLFPNGKLLSSRWRIALGMTAVGMAVGISAFAFASPQDLGLSGRNPLAIPAFGRIANTVMWVGLGMLFLGVILAAASLIVRMRRSRGEERQQFKWLVFGAALLPIGNAIASMPLPSIVQNVGVCAIGAFPVAVGVAILKHRLYDIDVVINRALVYAMLTGILGLMYAVTVVVLQRALGGVTEGSNIAVAGSTLAVAALFSPVRGAVQTFIDHRFYRRRYDAAATLGEFSSRLRDQVDLGTLTQELSEVISQTMQPAHVSVWLRHAESSPSGEV